MSRQSVTQLELLRWLNAEMSRQFLCTGCAFTTIHALSPPDADGCNWSVADFACKGTPAAVCAPKANQMIVQARAAYNLESIKTDS